MYWVLTMSDFWVLHNCQYARILNFWGYTWCFFFWKYIEVLNTCQDAIMEGFWIFQDFKFARFLHIQVLCKFLNMPDFGWIMPEFKLFWLWQRSEYAWSKFHKVLSLPPVLNMPGFGIWQGCELNMWGYTSCWISQNALIMLNNVSVYLNMPAYTWINRVLNMPEFCMCLL